MSGIFDGLFLISDVDGTLLNSKSELTKKNLDAINYFRANGGRFSLATGRTPQSAKTFLDATEVTELAVMYNGGAIYHRPTGVSSDIIFLPEQAKLYIKKIHSDLAFTGIVVVTEKEHYNAGCNDEPNKYVIANRELGSISKVPFDEISEDWVKILICHEPRLKSELNSYLGARSFEGVEFISSSSHFIEMLPIGSSKGGALKKIAERTGIEQKQVIAVGDYHNDISMIKFAGLGVAVANAQAEVKAAADMVACSCDENAIAYVIEYIEKNIKIFR